MCGRGRRCVPHSAVCLGFCSQLGRKVAERFGALRCVISPPHTSWHGVHVFSFSFLPLCLISTSVPSCKVSGLSKIILRVQRL